MIWRSAVNAAPACVSAIASGIPPARSDATVVSMTTAEPVRQRPDRIAGRSLVIVDLQALVMISPWRRRSYSEHWGGTIVALKPFRNSAEYTPISLPSSHTSEIFPLASPQLLPTGLVR